MEHICTHNELHINSYDPTRTTVLRNTFAKAMKSRFSELITIIQKSVVDEDVFGLNKIGTFQMSTPGKEAFSFSRDEVKLAQFLKWLQEQVDKGLLDIRDLQQVGSGVEGAWTNKYIYDSYKRGVIRARIELKKAGYDVTSIDDSGGIEAVLSTPFHIDRIGLIYTRVYSALKGITASMDSQISQILAQGLADGDNPRLLARKLVAAINGTGMGDLGITDSLGRFIPAARRAEMLARTEVIRAHHLGMIQEYKNWGLTGVYVQAEWVTAGDRRVCTRCSAMAKGGPYTLEQITNLIPYHPLCRCVALPILINNK